MIRIFLEMFQDELTLGKARSGDSRHDLVPLSDSIPKDKGRETVQTETVLSLKEEVDGSFIWIIMKVPLSFSQNALLYI